MSSPVVAPRAVRLETPVCSPPVVTVAAPRSPHGRLAAREIAGALERLGAPVSLADDPDASALLDPGGPVIVVGNLADSLCVRSLYFSCLCATDLWYPGPGGYELRTICDPFATGRNVVLVGYSDAEGAQAAARAFVDLAVDPLPRLFEVKPTRLPMSDAVVALYRETPLPEHPWQVANSSMGGRKGYLYYLTGEPRMAEEFRQAWRAILEAGFGDDIKPVCMHLMAVSRVMPWLLLEGAGVFADEERLATTRYLYEWANSHEGADFLWANPRVRSDHACRQNHELMPALALACLADYFERFYPDLPGPEGWRAAAAQTYAPYGASWKPLCDGLCHGWFLSQPAMLEYGLRDPAHRYFEEGGARRAAECAVAVVNNQGWMPSSGDSGIGRSFPGPSLRVAAAWYGDGRYKYVHDLGPESHRLMYMVTPARAFDSGVEPVEPVDHVGVKAIPVDPLVYHVWEREPEVAASVVDRAPDAPIEQCFDKLAVRTGWGLADDYLLIDGLSGGSHSYADAGGILDYGRLGVSAIVSEDSLVQTAPECHSLVTVARDGEYGRLPGFAILEASDELPGGDAYLRLRLEDCAGADWVREVFLLAGRGLVVHDTVTVREPGACSIAARFRTPAPMTRDGRSAISRRESPCVGEVEFRLSLLDEVADVSVESVDQVKGTAELWRERYGVDGPCVSIYTARRAGEMQAGESVSFTTLAQVRGPDEPMLEMRRAATGVVVTGAGRERLLEPALWDEAASASAVAAPAGGRVLATETVAELDAPLTTLRPAPDGGAVAGAEDGRVTRLDPDGKAVVDLRVEGRVRDVGSLPDGERLLVGHGDDRLTAFDAHGAVAWERTLERDPCPWPWWELDTPAPVRVVGGEDDGKPFFLVGCGDIQLRCLEADGRERWRFRNDHGPPAQLMAADVDGSGRTRILCGGDLRCSFANIRVLAPEDARVLTVLELEGWTSRVTAMALGEVSGRRLLAGGASRGRNLHLFDVGEPRLDSDPVERLFSRRLAGEVTGLCLLPEAERLVAATDQGFVLGLDLSGEKLWVALLGAAVRGLAPFGGGVLALDASGAATALSAEGERMGSARLPGGPVAFVATPKGALAACGRRVVRVAAPQYV